MQRVFGNVTTAIVVIMSGLATGAVAGTCPGGHYAGGTGPRNRGSHLVCGSGPDIGEALPQARGRTHRGAAGAETDLGSPSYEAFRERLVPIEPMYRLGRWPSTR